jgi:ribosomal protein S6--L-glutamate ligase
VTDVMLFGWEEWVALPELGLPAIKAKIDTGARTSALHASSIALGSEDGIDVVRFTVRPIPGRTDIEVAAAARVIDRREVTSSNGDTEERLVIRTPLAVGGRSWPIEVTLTNRETMAYRMLIGRQALAGKALVDPSGSFVQPRLSRKLYGRKPATRRTGEAPARS